MADAPRDSIAAAKTAAGLFNDAADAIAGDCGDRSMLSGLMTTWLRRHVRQFGAAATIDELRHAVAHVERYG